MENDPDFTGKVVLITGATGTFGQCLSMRFAAAGADLLLHGRDQKKLETLQNQLLDKYNNGQQFNIVVADLSRPDFFWAFAKALADIKRVDVLINNAATHGPIGPFMGLDILDWQMAFNTNFFSQLRISQMIIPEMIKNGGGRIINISGGGATGSRPNFTSYAIAKTALVRLTELLADELNGTGVLINAIAPGAMASNLLKEVASLGEEKAGKAEVVNAKKYLTEGGSTDKASELCLFLASDKNDFINGRLISAQWDDWKGNIKDRLAANKDIFKLRRLI